MRHRRPSQSGVTLIEMLVALAVSSMVGLAGFILLESVTRAETGVTGRLDRIKAQDRAFQLISLDVRNARSASISDALILDMPGRKVTWQATDQGLARRIAFTERMPLEQRLLDEAATFTERASGALVLTLPEQGIWRILSLPTGSAR